MYDNSGGRGQFLCKICDTRFNRQNYIDYPPELSCPHCGKALELKKKRNSLIFTNVPILIALIIKIP